MLRPKDLLPLKILARKYSYGKHRLCLREVSPQERHWLLLPPGTTDNIQSNFSGYIKTGERGGYFSSQNTNKAQSICKCTHRTSKICIMEPSSILPSQTRKPKSPIPVFMCVARWRLGLQMKLSRTGTEPVE